jgi:putative SOS response-associated peptidase YedK
MCGRYYRKSDKKKIADAFHAAKVNDFPLPPWDYKVAPTSMQPIIRQNRDTGERELVQLRWGSSLPSRLNDESSRPSPVAHDDHTRSGVWEGDPPPVDIRRGA